jgi:excisionase family DNA binding protein
MRARLLTTGQAASALGVSPWTLRAAVKRGDFPAMRLGSRGLYRFDPGVIRDLLDQARGQTIEGDLVPRPRAARLGTATGFLLLRPMPHKIEMRRARSVGRSKPYVGAVRGSEKSLGSGGRERNRLGEYVL